MSRRLGFAIALFLLCFLAGGIVSYLRAPREAWFLSAAATLIAVGAGVAGTLVFMRLNAPQADKPTEHTTSPPAVVSHQPADPTLLPRPEIPSLPVSLIQTELPRVTPVLSSAPSVQSMQVYWLSPHLALTRSADRLNLRLNDFGRYQFIKLSLRLPHAGLSHPPYNRRQSVRAASNPISYLGVLVRPAVLPWLLFGLSLLVFAITRLVALDQFPIYFFSDEAVNPVLASELLQRGMRDTAGNWFPPYFQNGAIWSLSLSVYIHALTVWLFGVSIWATRATDALIALSSAAAVGLTFKYIFNVKWWWLGTLVLAAIPAWFLHSRTGFETVLMVSFYGWFLFTYLLYRYRDARFIYAALIFGAATFYSYANAQAIMAVTAVWLALSDLPYHLKQQRVLLPAAVVIVLLAIPYLRFRLAHTDALSLQLHVVDSYWLKPVPLQDKLHEFVDKYLYALNPLYWFVPNNHDLIRHRMNDYGHIVWWFLPFFLTGILVCLARFKSAAYRVLLIALVAAPVGSALADILVTRALLFVIPAAMLSLIGLDFLISRFRSVNWQWAAATAATAFLIVFSFDMLNDAVVNGALWYDNYSLGGMQWGAEQLFTILKQERQANPQMPIYVSSGWANGAGQFVKFFMPNDPKVTTRTIDTWIDSPVPLSQDMLLVVTPPELSRAQASGKFNTPTIERALPYPNGTPGFYFARFTYVPNVDQIFQKEREERAQPVTEQVQINGETVQVVHSRMDLGQVKDMFDGDSYSLSRGLEANPLLVELDYPSPRAIHGLYASFGKMNFTITVSLFAPNASTPKTYTRTVKSPADIPEVTMTFDDPPATVERVRVAIQNLDAAGATKIHIRELQMR